MTNFNNSRAQRNGRPGKHSANPKYGKHGPHFSASDQARTRASELKAQGEHVSIAEKILQENSPDDFAQEAITEPDGFSLTQLQQLNLDQLKQYATDNQHQFDDQTSRKDLLMRIVSDRAKRTRILYGEGTLEILPDGFGFLRQTESHYYNCMDDIYVSPSQIRKFDLRTGSLVSGQIRPPKNTEKYFALLRVDSVNGLDPLDERHRLRFDDLTPLHPDKRIVMEFDEKELSTRVVDMLVPIGFGQRALIVSPPRAGKTILMQNMARAVIKNYPDTYVIMLLVDERPEEVTDMKNEVQGDQCEVISSTFDEATQRHVAVAEMVLEKAKRLVEGGKDVVIFLDSITRLARAWNNECTPSGKTLTGGLDANAMQKPKAFFGAARKVEEGGSLTIVATALINTGSRMDDVIFEEFKGTGNQEIILDRTLVDRRIWPALDVNRSGTRHEERLFDPDEYERICMVRRVLSELNPPDAMERLTERLKKTKSNAEFLMSLKSGVV
jgi:transcription termination factor Rho